jgi:hypothetical protein
MKDLEKGSGFVRHRVGLAVERARSLASLGLAADQDGGPVHTDHAVPARVFLGCEVGVRAGGKTGARSRIARSVVVGCNKELQCGQMCVEECDRLHCKRMHGICNKHIYKSNKRGEATAEGALVRLCGVGCLVLAGHRPMVLQHALSEDILDISNRFILL